MNEKVQPKTLPGFMELLPNEQIKYYLQKQEEKQKNKYTDLTKGIQT